MLVPVTEPMTVRIAGMRYIVGYRMKLAYKY